MGREVRRVPEHWQHPEDDSGEYIPLMRDYRAALEYRNPHHEWYDPEGTDPDPAKYIPEWPENEKTHIQMYETCSEGTPISPVMDTPENLAHWLEDNDASASGYMTATYEEWLAVCKGSFTPTAVLLQNGKLISGVEALSKLKTEKE